MADALSAITLTSACVASVLGFAWLAMAMQVHWKQVHTGAGPTRLHQRALRLLGSLGLAASLGRCLAADATSMAILVWMLLLACGAIVVALTLCWRPRALRLIWPWRD